MDMPAKKAVPILNSASVAHESDNMPTDEGPRFQIPGQLPSQEMPENNVAIAESPTEGMIPAKAVPQQVAQMRQQRLSGLTGMAQQQVRPAMIARPITWQQPLAVSQQRAAGMPSAMGMSQISGYGVAMLQNQVQRAVVPGWPMQQVRGPAQPGMIPAKAVPQQVAQMRQQRLSGLTGMAQQQVRPAMIARPITWQQPLAVSQQRAAGMPSAMGMSQISGYGVAMLQNQVQRANCMTTEEELAKEREQRIATEKKLEELAMQSTLLLGQKNHLELEVEMYKEKIEQMSNRNSTYPPSTSSYSSAGTDRQEQNGQISNVNSKFLLPASTGSSSTGHLTDMSNALNTIKLPHDENLDEFENPAARATVWASTVDNRYDCVPTTWGSRPNK